MLLIDDLLLAPIRGLVWALEKIHAAARDEMAGEPGAITEELRQLYMMLETGRVTEAEFSARELELLERLDATWERGSDSEEEEEQEAEEKQGRQDDEEAGRENDGEEA